ATYQQDQAPGSHVYGTDSQPQRKAAFVRTCSSSHAPAEPSLVPCLVHVIPTPWICQVSWHIQLILPAPCWQMLPQDLMQRNPSILKPSSAACKIKSIGSQRPLTLL